MDHECQTEKKDSTTESHIVNTKRGSTFRLHIDERMRKNATMESRISIMKVMRLIVLMFAILLFVTTSVAEEQSELFYCDGFRYSVLEDGTAQIVEYVDDKAKKIEIPKMFNGIAVTSIGNKAFSHFEKLKQVIIPEGVTEIGDYAFYWCTNLTSVTIPESVTKIGVCSFRDCGSLKSFTIPNSLIELGDYAFQNCSNITKIIIPDSVTTVGDNPFSDCYRIAEIYVSADHPVLATIDNALYSKPDKRLICYPRGLAESEVSIWKKDVVFEIPSGIRIVGADAFKECRLFTEIIIPDSVVTIEKGAFSGCWIKQIIIPDSVTQIGEEAFSHCSSIENVIIPSSIETIEYKAFYNCTKLQKVMISDGVKSIKDRAFYSCKSLSEIEIPNSVTEIGEMAFGYCKSLYSITIPQSEVIIKANPFAGSRNLMEIDLSASHPTLKVLDQVLFSRKDKRLLYYPAQSELKTYEIPKGTEIIGNMAFYNCNHLETVTIPDSVILIEDDAFEDSKHIMFYVSHDSYAAQYCNDNNLNYSYPDTNDWLND